MKDSKRKNCRDFLKVSRSEYDRLIESSPNIDRDIINTFNSKFEANYPHIRKPIVCNGLKKIVIYRTDEEDEESPDMVDILKKQDNDKINIMIQERDELIKSAFKSKP